MAVNCAACPTYTCRLGHTDLGPDDCPMKDDFPDPAVLYDDDKIRLAREAALIEARGYREWTRLEETVELATQLGVSTVGVGYCPDVEPEVHAFARYLEDCGFQVVLPEPHASGSCTPLEQAHTLRVAGAELNVIAGMCVGHDALFMKAVRVPVVALIARDTFLQHNPVAALYGARGYFRNALDRAHKQPRSDDTDTESLLQQAAQDPLGEPGAELASIADAISREGTGKWSRIEEVLEFAARGGARKLGIVFCHGLREEAKVLDRVLRVNGFEVASVGCKAGAYPKEFIRIEDHEQVNPGGLEVMCNPLAQAELLNREKTDLNLLLGQCVGHDTATIAALDALAVYVVVKDRVLAHNTVAALYRKMAADRR